MTGKCGDPATGTNPLPEIWVVSGEQSNLTQHTLHLCAKHGHEVVRASRSDNTKKCARCGAVLNPSEEQMRKMWKPMRVSEGKLIKTEAV